MLFSIVGYCTIDTWWAQAWYVPPSLSQIFSCAVANNWHALVTECLKTLFCGAVFIWLRRWMMKMRWAKSDVGTAEFSLLDYNFL